MISYSFNNNLLMEIFDYQDKFINFALLKCISYQEIYPSLIHYAYKTLKRLPTISIPYTCNHCHRILLTLNIYRTGKR